MIRSGFDGELDELRNLSQHSKQIIASMEERERKRTGIGSLKIRFNSIFGYYIEISKVNLHLAPADYERKQTLVNAERFTSPELKEYERKILAADERIAEIECRLFVELRSGVAAHATRLRVTAGAIAQLDVLTSFAKLAAERGYCRPEFNATGELLIVEGRHPVIEELLRQRGERFVPNDLYLEIATAAIAVDYRAEYGGQVDVSAAGGVDCVDGADGVVLCRRGRRNCRLPTGFSRGLGRAIIWRAGGRLFWWR